MKHAQFYLASALLLTGCGGTSQTSADNAAAQLDNAADVSNPAASAVLENEADNLRSGATVAGNSSDPDGSIQRAMENAANAQGE